MTTIKKAPRQPGHRHAQGVALIEALVAMLLFSLGVLALVGLQTSMVKAQTDAKVRADAAYLASEVVGKMWADLSNIGGYNGEACASQVRCKEWQDKVATMLPNGSGTVTVDSGTNDVTVTIGWESPEHGSAHNYVTQTTIVGAGS